MKNIIIIIAIILVPTSVFSQDNHMKKLFNSYKSVQGFDLEKSTSDMNIDMNSSNDFTDLLNNVKEIYVLNIDNKESSNSKIDKFRKEVDRLIEKNKYSTLMDISSDGVFKMLVKRDKDDEPTDVLIINKDEDDITYIWATQ